MIFLVNDANILIDLLKIDLLEAFFQLNYDFQVTDMVVAEITEDNVDELDGLLKYNYFKLNMQVYPHQIVLAYISLKSLKQLYSLAIQLCVV